MSRITKIGRRIGLLTALTAMPAVAVGTGQASAEPEESPRAPMHLEIDLSERTLYVHHGADSQTFPIAVGMPEYPTPTGDFQITQVTWNPDWRPPSSEWSEDEDYAEPDDPDNPMGKVKIMWKAPDYTIHGTDALDSLGKNVSHGSVRLANEDAIRLAKRVMAHGGVGKSQDWYEMAVRNDSDQHVVELEQPLDIRVHE